ncbi:MAG: reverse transcriptase N-terminal domain-containing protein [Prochloron sp. SP5CPC1]|nr:reverse transcriptase N-terminal domain-containing protein [Candidatus Paraprochloron terpiosi SP5CPC1]
MPWRIWSRQGERIQRGIYKAARQNNNRRVKWLQTTLIRSRAAQVTPVGQVTQINTGKKTPGVDGKIALTTNERLRLCVIVTLSHNQRRPQHWHDWKHRKLKRVEIPKRMIRGGVLTAVNVC